MERVTYTVSRRMVLGVLFAVMMAASMLALPMMNTEADDGSGTVRVASIADLTDFNIFNLGSNSVHKINMLKWTYEGLAAFDIDNEPYPRLATGWTFYEDTLTVDVDLRQGVLFHDGVEMTADDVVYSYLMMRGGTTYSDALSQAFDANGDGTVSIDEFGAGVQKTGEYSVRFVMAGPYSQFFSKTLTVPILPMHIWDDPVNGFTDYLDRVVVTASDELMTTGTGPFYYAGGVRDDYRVLEKSDLYWGEGVLTPSGYDLCPPNVDRLEFLITFNMDAALIALKRGDVDYISASVPAASLSAIDTDPAISIDYMADAGYFYLAFNEKKEPFGSLAFRQAVSHLIDKEQIAEVYLGGMGVEGNAVVPPYFDGWHNDAVAEYVYDDPTDPTTTIPEDILDAAGFIDGDGDGWRDLPDGSPMEKITILAPPADYDPVRARAAEAIANNMVAAGIHAEAVPIDFNTLVGHLTAFDYQMLTLGWSFTGYTECVSLVFDIYGAAASSNSWGFWSEANENPWYSDLGGVSTLADAETQALVDQLAEVEALARSSFITSEQIDLVKTAQEIIAEAVPCNVLYHRINAEAHRDSWTGWVPYMGNLLNMFSLSELVGGSEAPVYEDASAGVNVGLSAQRTAAPYQSIDGHAMVIDDLGDPVEGAAVSVSFEPLSADPMVLNIFPASGTTGPDGVFRFEVHSESVGYGVLGVTASSGAYSDEDSFTVSFSRVIPTTVSLSAQVSPATVRVGEPATISLTVTDETGAPVEGAEVVADESMICPGEVSPSVALTDASGHATMTYTAPYLLSTAGHDLERILLSASKDGCTFDSTAYVEILVYNDAAPDWMLVSIGSVTTTALSQTSPSATVSVLLTDAGGTPIAGETLDVTYSDPAMVSGPVASVTTGTDGTAVFGVTAADTGSSGALRVSVGKLAAPDAIGETVTFTYIDPEDMPAAPMYGGYAQYSADKFVDVFGSVELTFHVFDSYGVAADGITGSVLLAATDYGQMTYWSGSEYNTLYDYAGMRIVTAADGVDMVSTGAYSAPEYIDYWMWDDMTGDWVALDIQGVDIVGGIYSMTIEGVDLAHLDQALSVYLCPDSTAEFDWTMYNHVITGETTISSGYGYGRCYDVVSVSHVVSKPVMSAYNSLPYDTSSVTATVVDQDGEPVEGCRVYIRQSSSYMNADYGVLEYAYDYWVPTALYTGADGTVSATVLALQNSGVATQSTDEAALRVAPVTQGTICLTSQSCLFIHPRMTTTVGVPPAAPLLIGAPAQVQATLASDDGEPLTEATVAMTAGTDVTVRSVAAPDGAGLVTFDLDTSRISSSEGGFVPVLFASSGPGYAFSSARLMVPVKNPRPDIVITEPGEGEILDDATVTIRGYVLDSNGVQSVTVSVDGQPYTVPGYPGDTYWTFDLTVLDLVDGEHHVTVTATDSLGVSASVIRGFEVAANSVLVFNYGGSPSGNAVSTLFRPASDGIWQATVENNGLKGLVIDVYDMSTGLPVEVASIKVSLAKVPVGTVTVEGYVPMTGDTPYILAFMPLGPEGGSATVTWTYFPAP